MRLTFWSLVKGVVFLWLLWIPRFEGQFTNPQTMPARALDATLQDYAYRAFVHPRTGIPYDGVPPANLNGIEISAMRLRSGSLYHRGVETFREFRIPVGLREQPYVERLILVYQNLGNWSSTYYSLPGYAHLTPVLGLLAYNGSDLTAVDLPELDLWASEKAMTIKFEEVSPVPAGLVAKCAWFDLHGQVNFTDVVNENVCLTTEQGHFTIVVESAAAPEQEPPATVEGHPEAPSKKDKDSWVWGIVGSVCGGVALLVLLALMIVLVWKYKKRKKMRELERAADAGEALRMTRVGSILRAPYALPTRTMPQFEINLGA
uniref:uncharacterized protein LOC122583166 n=1 Tax=Erigeron canadensis TaxID=72917 RepID=UPI001CB91399|nr:uncharacterized protein LOC122583166 [Erigeron canadensis]